MKKIVSFLIVLFSFLSINLFAQKDPTTWTYEAKKKSDNTYEIIITATLPKPWHVYSTKDETSPTKINLTANPLISKVGTVTEQGKLVKKFDPDLKENLQYYNDKVVFTQVVKLKTKAKTTVAGTVEYIVCNDEKCLPPKKLNFSVKLN